MKTMTALALGLALTVAAASAAGAAPVVHSGPPAAPIATTVEVPAGSDLVYVSGQLAPVVDKAAAPGTVAAYGDAATQTANIFKKIKDILAEKGLSLGDIVMMRIYMVADPAAADGKMDFAGMMKGYTQFFGTPEQPNKPSRSTVQVANLAGPGFLLEIEVLAARAK